MPERESSPSDRHEAEDRVRSTSTLFTPPSGVHILMSRRNRVRKVMIVKAQLDYLTLATRSMP